MTETNRVGLEKPVFALMHGSWHSKDCWKVLEDELLRLGIDTIPIDFLNDIPGKNFDDHARDAQYIIEKEAADREVVLIAHSRSANVAPRLAGAIALKHIVYLCGSFEPSTLFPLLENRPVHIREPRKYSDELIASFSSDKWGLSAFNNEAAKHFFYHDCPPDIQEEACAQLRMQYKTPHEPILEDWPDQSAIPQTYVLATNDRVISPSWSEYMAEHVLQVPLIAIESGHSPFYSQAQKLASLLVTITLSEATVPIPRHPLQPLQSAEPI